MKLHGAMRMVKMWRVHRYKVRKIAGVQHVTHVARDKRCLTTTGLFLVSQNLLLLFLLPFLKQQTTTTISHSFTFSFIHSLQAQN